jgi:apolipoprotein N-acyltransferase
VTQDQKWLPENFQPTLDLYRSSLLENSTSSLIVWPEVAIPAALDNIDGYVESLQAELRRNGQTLMFGVLERSNRQVFNSVVMLDGESRQFYRKRHLVPFGEMFPVPDFVREWMRLMSLPNSDMSAGASEQPLLEMRGGQKLAVAICYEDAYGAEQLYALPDAAILINVSNDAWFGDSIAPHQHLEIARMRALEAGRYVIRATNTGISGIIGPRGKVQFTMPQFAEVSSTMDVAPYAGLTPYARFGNWPAISLAFVIIVAFGWRLRQTRAV